MWVTRMWIARKWVARKWVARPARGSPASCRGATASTPRGSFLSPCGQFVPLFFRDDRRNLPWAGWRGTPPCIGRDVQPTGHRTGRPTHWASDGTSNPLGIGRDVQPTCGSRESGSRVPREAPRHPAGERWRQRNADRSSRPAASSCLSSFGTIVVSCPGQGGAGRRPASDGTSNPHVDCAQVGRASRARLPGILPGSDGVNATRIVPLARRSVGDSLLSGRSS